MVLLVEIIRHHHSIDFLYIESILSRFSKLSGPADARN
jgi:hypothetical protein